MIARLVTARLFAHKYRGPLLIPALLTLLPLLAGCRHQTVAPPPAPPPAPAPPPPTPVTFVLDGADHSDPQVKAPQDRYAAFVAGGSAEHLSNQNAYRSAMQIFLDACREQGYTAIWPHQSDVDTLGVIVPNNAANATPESKQEIAEALGDEFGRARQQGRHPGSYSVIVRFQPSGQIFIAKSAGSPKAP